MPFAAERLHIAFPRRSVGTRLEKRARRYQVDKFYVSAVGHDGLLR